MTEKKSGRRARRGGTEDTARADAGEPQTPPAPATSSPAGPPPVQVVVVCPPRGESGHRRRDPSPRLAAWTIGSIAAAATACSGALSPYLPWLLGASFVLALLKGGHLTLTLGRRVGGK